MEVLKSLIDFTESWGALVIAGISLLVAVVSLVKSTRAQKIQTQVNKLELQIKKYELKNIEKEQAAANNPCIEARMITIGAGKHRLKIWNSGNATAYNVVAMFEEGSNIIIMDSEKMPYDELEPNKNFELALITHGGSASKFKIITEWADAEGEQHSKAQMGDL